MQMRYHSLPGYSACSSYQYNCRLACIVFLVQWQRGAPVLSLCMLAYLLSEISYIFVSVTTVSSSTRHSFTKVAIYLLTKFQCDVSIHGWDFTTFGFDLDHSIASGVSFCTGLPKLHPNRTTPSGVVTSSIFQHDSHGIANLLLATGWLETTN